jgi:hypothetical protein
LSERSQGSRKYRGRAFKGFSQTLRAWGILALPPLSRAISVNVLFKCMTYNKLCLFFSFHLPKRLVPISMQCVALQPCLTQLYNLISIYAVSQLKTGPWLLITCPLCILISLNIWDERSCFYNTLHVKYLSVKDLKYLYTYKVITLATGYKCENTSHK